MNGRKAKALRKLTSDKGSYKEAKAKYQELTPTGRHKIGLLYDLAKEQE